MSSTPRAQADTALSPEWDRGFDEAFVELVSSDPDLTRTEFDALIGACWSEPPAPPGPPAPSAAQPAQPYPQAPPEAGAPETARATENGPGDTIDNQRSPP